MRLFGLPIVIAGVLGFAALWILESEGDATRIVFAFPIIAVLLGSIFIGWTQEHVNRTLSLLVQSREIIKRSVNLQSKR